MASPNGWKADFKAWLLSTRMARYPLLTVFLIAALLAALWYMDPNFVRFLGTGAGSVGEEQGDIGSQEGDLNP